MFDFLFELLTRCFISFPLRITLNLVIQTISRVIGWPQIGPSYEMWPRNPQSQKVTSSAVFSPIHVRRLAKGKLFSQQPLAMHGHTFMKGVDYLFEQIHNRVRAIDFDLIVGVNPAGAAAAALLHGRLRGARLDPPPFGIVLAGVVPRKKQDREYVTLLPDPSAFPKGKIRNILIVDSEFKTGKNISRVEEEIRAFYKIREPSVIVCECECMYLAVLVLCGIHMGKIKCWRWWPRIRDMWKFWQLRTWRRLAQCCVRRRGIRIDTLLRSHFNKYASPTDRRLFVPHFVAFFTPGTIQAPHRIT